jgi:putative ABC transport system substrate-binding protein
VQALGLQLVLFKADSEAEIEKSFTMMNEHRVGAVHILQSPFLVTRAKLIAAFALRYGLPTSYSRREFADAGGLMSYGPSIAEVYRFAGIYAGRILTGTKPADLPVYQSTRSEFIINLNTAKALGLTVPPTLLALADELIE